MIFEKRGATSILGMLALSIMIAAINSSSSHADLIARGARLLQGSTEVTISEDPSVKKWCDDNGVKKTDITLTLEQRNEKRADTSKRYEAQLEIIKKTDVSNPNTSELGNSVAATGAGFALVVAILAFLSLIFLFFWSICECCCDKTCCVEQEKKMEGRKGWFRWTCFIGAYILGVVCVAMTIAWSALIGKFLGRSSEIKCSFTILYSDFIFGADLGGGSKFLGLNGIDTIFGQIITLLDSIDGVGGIRSSGQNIKDRNIGTAVTTMQNNYNSFKGSFDTNNYRFKGTIDNTIDVTSGFAVMVKASLDSGALKAEVDTLASIANGIASTGATIAEYDVSSIASTKSSINNARTQFIGKYKTEVQSLYNSMVDNPNDIFKQIKDAGTSFMIASIIVIIVFTLLYFVILFFNIKDKWHKAKCISKIIMLFQLLLAILILIMSIIGVVVGIILAVICFITDDVIASNTPLSTINFSGKAAMMTFFQTCINKNGNGDFLGAAGMDLSSITKINSITDGMQGFTTLKNNLTSQANPLVGGWLSGNITGGQSYDIQLRGVPENQDLTTGLNKVNEYGCAGDVMVFKDCPSGRTNSATTDTATSVSSNYCMRHPSLSTTHYSGRYVGLSATCTTGSANDADTVLFNTATAADLHKTKLDNLNNDFNNGIYTAELDVFTKLKTSVTDLDTILNKIQGVINSLNTIGGSLSKLTNCTVLRKEVIMFENVICFRIAEDYYHQTNVGIALGFLLFVYSWFMCCSIRLANKQDDNNAGGNNLYRDEPKDGMPPQEQNANQYDNYQ